MNELGSDLVSCIVKSKSILNVPVPQKHTD